LGKYGHINDKNASVTK